MDQMLKGPRFIWFYWTQCNAVDFDITADAIIFKGSIRAFRETGKWITHERTISIEKSQPVWTITDIIDSEQPLPLKQNWHPHPDMVEQLVVSATDGNGNPLQLEVSEAYYSPTYGVMEQATQMSFSTLGNKIITTIKLR
jgi:hypothetical protein